MLQHHGSRSTAKRRDRSGWNCAPTRVAGTTLPAERHTETPPAPKEGARGGALGSPSTPPSARPIRTPGMYDALTSRYTFACPTRGESRVALSSFRRLERLPGTAHPAVYRIRFDCPCGDEHDGLVSHDDLDWAPLGLDAGVFLNLMTARVEPVAAEVGDLAAARIGAGEWPWSFYCYPEERPRPVFPSAFSLLAPGEGSLGLAVRCPVCGRLSVNLVVRARRPAVPQRPRDRRRRARLPGRRARHDCRVRGQASWSAGFDARRLELLRV